MTGPAVTHRPLRDHADFLRVRQLLIDTYPLYGTYTNWEIRRWEGQWYWGEPGAEEDVRQYAHLWESESGELVGAVHIEGSQPGNAWIEIHPDYRHIEPEMIAHAEAHLAKTGADGQRSLDWYIYDDDMLRRDLLAARGYTETDNWEVLRRRPLADLLALIPTDATPPPGYVVRSLQRGSPADTAAWADVVVQVFTRSQATAEIIHNFQQSPSYNHDLHLVAQGPDGDFVAFAGLTVDPANRAAVFEPVGTRADHRQQKLASLVMWEGLRRLHVRGDVDMVYVGTAEQVPANRLYDALGFIDVRKMHRWHKTW